MTSNAAFAPLPPGGPGARRQRESASGERHRESERHVDAADARQPGEVDSGGQDQSRQQPSSGAPKSQPQPQDKYQDRAGGRQRCRQAHRPLINLPAAQPGDAGHEPVIQRRLLQFRPTIVQARPARAVGLQQALCIHGRSCFMAAPQVALAQAVEEEHGTENGQGNGSTSPKRKRGITFRRQ